MPIGKFGAPLSPDQRKVLVACLIGAAFGYGTLGVAMFGQLVAPLGAALNHSREQIGFAFSAMAADSIAGSPVAGALIDRFGTRIVVSASGVLMAGTFCALAQASSLVSLYLLYGVMALAGSGTLVVAYSRPIIGTFHDRRGTALGTMLAVIGAAAAVLPVALVAIISIWGAQGAFYALAAFSVLGIAPAAFLLPARNVGGVEQIRHDWRPIIFTVINSASSAGWKLLTVGLLLGIFTSGVWGQAMPILTAKGLSDTAAAATMGGLAVVLTLTRLAAGVAMDRYFAPYIGVALLAPVTIGWLLVATTNSPTLAIAAVLLFGLGVGIEFDLFSYLSSKYLPPEMYGTFYGLLYSSVSVGLAVGPIFSSIARRTISPDQGPAFTMLIVTLIASCLLARLPRYSADTSAEAVCTKDGRTPDQFQTL